MAQNATPKLTTRTSAPRQANRPQPQTPPQSRSRSQPQSQSQPQPHSQSKQQPRPRTREKAAAFPEATFLRNAAEGVGAVVAAFAAMLAAAALGLVLVGASPRTSLFPASAGVVSLAFGGSARVGTDTSIGGFLSAGMAGNLRVMPLGIGVLGAVVLGLVFYLPLRNRRTDQDAFVIRTALAACTAFFALLVISLSAQGTVNLPKSVTDGMTPKSGPFGGGSGLGDMLSGLTSQITDSFSHIGYQVNVVTTVFGGLLWTALVLWLGAMAARRARLPKARSRSKVRKTMGPAVSAVITVVVGLTAVLFVLGAVAAPVMSGGNGAKAAGAMLLAGPNVVFAALSIGTGVPWSMSTARDSTSGGGGLSSLLGGGGLGGGSGGGGFTPTSRSLSLGSLASDHAPALAALLLLVVAVLLTSGVLAARRTPPRVTRDGAPLLTRGGRAKTLAIRLGVVWAITLFTAVLFGGFSGHVGVSMMSQQMLSMHARAGANALLALLAGLAAGAAAGYLGSLLHDARKPALRT